MGAWGAGTFDNDTACDWAGQLANINDLSLVTQTLAKVRSTGDDSLDADIATEALAACEVLARLKGHFGARSPYTENVDNWVAAHHVNVPPRMLQLAIEVIDRITEEPFELLDLWQEGDPAEWLEAVDELRARVRAGLTSSGPAV